MSENLLAIDTATESCSVALLYNDKKFVVSEICPQKHSQKVLGMVQQVLGEANANLRELSRLVVGHGPGSFTGVRIAVSMVQGLAYGVQKPVVGVSTLAAMAKQCSGQRIAVAIDARMGEVYFALFKKDNNRLELVGSESVLKPEHALSQCLEFNPDAFAGTGWESYALLAEFAGDREVSVLYPQAEAMLELALSEPERSVPAAEIVPIYLRDTVTWKKLPGRE